MLAVDFVTAKGDAIISKNFMSLIGEVVSLFCKNVRPKQNLN